MKLLIAIANFCPLSQKIQCLLPLTQIANWFATCITLNNHQRAGCSKGAAFGWESFSMPKPTAQSLRDESRELRERCIRFSNGQPLEDIFFPRLWPQK
jgi:hypothetical protein